MNFLPRSYAVRLLVLAVLLYLPGLGSRDFWAPVEPRYAEIARVMFARSEWLVPTVNGDLYTDKPILYFWLVLVASKIAGGVSEWTVRLPAAMGGVGLVLATYLFGRDFFSPRRGFIAGAVVGTAFRVLWEARWAHVDMLFVCLFAGAMLFAARSLFLRGSPSELLGAYALMGLATLTKGLIGIVLPALIGVLFIVVSRDWSLLRRLRIPAGLAVFLLVSAPWFLMVNAATEGRWLADFIYIHHVQRYTAGAGHRQPFYYYLTTLPVDFLPWTVLAVPALWAYRREPIREKPVLLFLVCWFAAVFGFFSLSDTKRDLYLLPLFPPVALLVASYIDDLAERRLPQDGLFRALVSPFSHLVWVTGAALPFVAWAVRPDALRAAIPAGAVLLVGGLGAAHSARARDAENLFRVVTLLMSSLLLTASAAAIPYLEQFKSRRPFSVEVRAMVPPAAPLLVYADTMNDFNYYTGREVIEVVRSPAEVEKLLSAPFPVYLLIKDRDLKKLGIPMEGRVVAGSAVGGTAWSLLKLGAR
ncbi:MAG TPA: glycosyltransferase family 39 protein [candidate division Zixibacteria bacterium]|nr:glycosyltransferase family 39 protein [candidate division Zixibacteria bacterium]